MHSKKSFSIVEAIIFNDNQEYLLLKRSPTTNFFKNKWQLVGGKVEPNESTRKAIKREIIEETNCNPINIKLKKVFSINNEVFDEVLSLNIFECKLVGNISLSNEHSEFGFFSLNKIKKMSLTPSSKKAIFEA